MRIIILLLLFINSSAYGQNIKLVQMPYGDYYTIENIDSFKYDQKLPDGQYRNFYNNDTSRLRYLFHLSNNKVTGFFLSHHQNGKWASVGSYLNDSLWTFLKDSYNHIDTSFKIAYWRYQTNNQYADEGRGMVEEYTYRIPYEANGTSFIDTWYNQDNSILSIRKYQKERGLMEEIWLDSKGQSLSEEKYEPNYTLSLSKTPTQFVNKITLNQKFKYEIHTGFESVEPYFNPTMEISDSSGNSIAHVSIDKSGKVQSIYGNHVTISFERDKATIQYWNKRHKLRFRELK